MFPANRFAPTNPNSPEPTGLCRRCGFYYPISQLVDQYEWRGPALAKILGRVCTRTCLDSPQEQLRTIVIGPDPVPVKDPSPTFYAQQSASPGYVPQNAPLMDDALEFQLTDDDGNPLVAT